MTTPADLRRIIGGVRVSLTNEKETQADISSALTQAGVPFIREHRLTARDIPDFFLKAEGIAVEVKIKGAVKASVFRQLTRYASHPDVKAVVLVSSLSMGLPEEIEGKPAYFISLSRGWL